MTNSPAILTLRRASSIPENGPEPDFRGVSVALPDLPPRPPAVFVDPPARHRLFDPIEELGGRVDLVVMFALRKDRHFVQVFSEPGCGFWDVNKPTFDQPGLGMKPHDFVALRLVFGDAIASLDDQFLDQLGARGLVLDQYHVGIEQALLLAHRPF